jgi:carbon-monoxide dehydrogenase medium subunit
MKPPPFEYTAPMTVAEAVGLLAQHELEAKILAGGQSLMPLLNMRLARPSVLVDVARIPDLDYVREVDGGLAIGAMARQRSVELSDAVRARHALVHAATMHIAHPQNRNQGTVGGSIAHADPAAEYPALALLLDAEVRVAGPAGERTIAARDFFVTYLTTALEPAEMLVEVRLPGLPAGTGWSIQELARRHGDFALAGVMATMSLDGAGCCAAARLVLFGVGATPIRADAAEAMLRGAAPDAKTLAAAAARAAADLEEPLTDVHATADYRRDLARVLARRALADAAARAAGSA